MEQSCLKVTLRSSTIIGRCIMTNQRPEKASTLSKSVYPRGNPIFKSKITFTKSRDLFRQKNHMNHVIEYWVSQCQFQGYEVENLDSGEIKNKQNTNCKNTVSIHDDHGRLVWMFTAKNFNFCKQVFVNKSVFVGWRSWSGRLGGRWC